VPLAGRPMIEWSIDALRASAPVVSIVVAAPPGHPHGLGGQDLAVVAGGATRAGSVANALEAVDTELVAVHDAARPLLTPALVEALVDALEAEPDAAGVIAATALTDTIKQAQRGVVERTRDRSRLWAAQTPQVFRTEALRAALAAGDEARAAATDEAMLIEAAGGTVLIHPIAAENLKITTPLDLRIAEYLLTTAPPPTASTSRPPGPGS
jgi:2-C-methyl-D-erythritol 4-phosphate cytidylyltransferase